MATGGNLVNLMFGNAGLRYITSGSSPEGEHYYVIFANEDAVVSMTNDLDGTASIVSMPIPAGSAIFGSFHALTLSSGKITCYIAP